MARKAYIKTPLCEHFKNVCLLKKNVVVSNVVHFFVKFVATSRRHAVFGKIGKMHTYKKI